MLLISISVKPFNRLALLFSREVLFESSAAVETEFAERLDVLYIDYIGDRYIPTGLFCLRNL